MNISWLYHTVMYVLQVKVINYERDTTYKTHRLVQKDSACIEGLAKDYSISYEIKKEIE